MRPFWFLARSIPGLTISGLLLVALPVAGLMISAIVHVDRITRATNESAARANEAVQLTRVIVDKLVDMERAAGQYTVLGDERLRRSFLAHRGELLSSVARLDALAVSDGHAIDVDLIREKEQVLFEMLSERLSPPRVPGAWAELGIIADSLLDRSRQHLDSAFESSAQAAEELSRRLTLQAATALPLTLVLVVLATRVIMRPLAGIDSAIRRLADDDFEQPIDVKGPSDVRRLGEALDALRLRIKTLEKQKVNFVRRISHELKTPLTTIRQGAELLADRRGTSVEQTVEIAEMLRESSLELQKLIEDLLEYGKTQHEPQSLVIEAVDLKEIVERVLADRALAVSAKELELHVALESVFVSGDSKQLRTVIHNLIDNAIKFSPPRGTITIALESDSGAANFEIGDTGPGIPRTDFDRVFEPFYQGKVQAPGPVKGTGLGLAIAKDHVTSHNGRIEIIEASAGAHFRVRLPLLQARG